MSLQLLTITDPRDNLEKARRPELVAYARANGVPDISEDVPAIVIRKRLRGLGLTRIKIPDRVLGQPSLAATPIGSIADADAAGIVTGEVSAEDDLDRQFEQARPRSPHIMAYNELRRHAKTLGVKFNRKDNLASMKAKVAAAKAKGAAG